MRLHFLGQKSTKLNIVGADDSLPRREDQYQLCVLPSFVWEQSLDVFNDGAEIQILEEVF